MSLLDRCTTVVFKFFGSLIGMMILWGLVIIAVLYLYFG